VELVSDLAPARVAELLKSGRAQLVDVRTDEEWEAGRIEGARHVSFDRLSAEAGSLDQGRPVVLYCRGGDRSATAATALAASGFEAHSLAGGLSAWAAEGRPLEPEDGRVAERSPLPGR